MHPLPSYIQDYRDFQPGQDTVLYSGPYWDQREIDAMIHNIQHGQWIVSGTEVERFQQQFSEKFHVQHSHMVNSGSSANLVMIAALKQRWNWQDGDEIIVSPVGFPTTIAPIVQNGLRPRFVDIEFRSLNFDLDQVRDAINSRTRAIFVSPVLGNPPDMDRILDMAQDHGILVIGDNCDSLGTRFGDQLLNQYYHSWTTSFYPAHHISTGEGGMISTNDSELTNLARSFSWWGRDCYCVGPANTLPCGTCGRRFSQWLPDYDGVIDHKYIYGTRGYNLKPLDLQGAVGQVQLTKFDEICQRRRDHKQTIEQALVDHVGIEPVQVLPQAQVSWFGVPVICSESGLREMLVSHFEANRIQTRNYFGGNILMHPAYRDLGDWRQYPWANQVLDRVFFLGCSPGYTQPVLDYIQHVIRQW